MTLNYDSRVALSFYKEIAPINQEHKVSLVQHIETGKIYVRKTLSVYSADVYRQLQNTPVAGVPRVYCVHEENNELTIIEEHISGETLEEVIAQKGSLKENQIVPYIVELCSILDKLHSFKPSIIHRDIKPSNIIITPEDHVVLIDLNAARSDISKMEDTVLLGTKGYAAPEQYGFGSSGIQTDIYAVGMLMNTMLYGSFSHEIYPDSSLTAIIGKCTKLDPKDRYASITELSWSLQKLTDHSQNKPRPYYRAILPPGFRSGTIWHMLIAIPVYAIIISLSLTFTPKNTYGMAVYYERIFSLLTFLLIIACATNYLNIQRIMPLCSHKNVFVRILGTIILCIVLTFFLIIFMLSTEKLFF